MTWKQKFWAWCLVAFSYLFTFVTPMVAAYFLLAENVASDESKGGFFYFLVIGLFGGALALALVKLLNKQKANMLKTIFRLGVKIAVIAGLIGMVKYVDFNLDKLLEVLYIGGGGMFVGSIFEAVAVGKFNAYIREVGAF